MDTIHYNKNNMKYYKLTSKLRTNPSQNINTIFKHKNNNQIFFVITKNQQVFVHKTFADITYLHALESTLNEWYSDDEV